MPRDRQSRPSGDPVSPSLERGSTPAERVKLLNRVRRMRGQLDTLERSLADDRDCAEILMLLAAVRGGINSLMGEVLEDHIRLHLLADGPRSLSPELGEDLIDLVRSYLK